MLDLVKLEQVIVEKNCLNMFLIQQLFKVMIKWKLKMINLINSIFQMNSISTIKTMLICKKCTMLEFVIINKLLDNNNMEILENIL